MSNYSGVQSLLTYQLGMYFICNLSRNNLNENEAYWMFNSLEELAYYLEEFIYIEDLSISSIHDALNRMNEIKFLYFEQIEPTEEEAVRDGSDKKKWVITLNIKECYEIFQD